MKATRYLLAALFFLGSARLLAEATPPTYSQIAASALSDLPSRAWGAAAQFVQADKAGRVFLLRKDTLELYQISAGGKLLGKGRLVKDSSFEVGPPVAGAALSPAGDAWVLFSFPNRLYVFRQDQVETLEAPWLVSAVVASGAEPLIAVAPGEMNTTAPTLLRVDRPPLLQQWDGKRWNTLVDGRFYDGPPEGVNLGELMGTESSVFLALTPERHLWMADQFAYRLRRFSPAGALQDELSIADGKITWTERTEKEWKEAETAIKRGGMAWSRRWLSERRAEVVFRGITLGRDGAVYLLAQTKDGLTLDRFQPTLLSLDRIVLKGLDLAPGQLSIAFGTRGLYIAPLNARNGIWFIDVEALDNADWNPVAGAMLNGQPLASPSEKVKNGTIGGTAAPNKAQGIQP